MPFIVSLKDFVYRYFPSLFLCELPAPPYPLTGSGTRTDILELHIAGSTLALFLPVMPAFRAYLLGQAAMHEQRIAIVAPRASQIDFIYIGGRSNGALVEHIAIEAALGG